MNPATAHLFSAYQRSKQIAFVQKTEWLNSIFSSCYHAFQHPKLFHQRRLIGHAAKLRTMPVNLFVIGEENSGKSTLINALVGGEVAHANDLPHTCCIHRHLYGSTRAIVYRKGARPMWTTHDAARQYWYQEEQRCSNSEQYVSSLMQIDWHHNQFPFLKLCVVVDTPGLGKTNDIRKPNIEEFYFKADAILWLFDATKLNKNTTLKIIDQVSRYSQKIVGVISKWDTIENQENRGRLLNQTDKIFGKYVYKLVTISAEQAIKSNIISDEDAYQASKLPVLSEIIRTEFLASSGIKRSIHRYHSVRMAISEAASLLSEEISVAKQNLTTFRAVKQLLRICQAEVETTLSQIARDFLKNDLFGDIYQLLDNLTVRDVELLLNAAVDQASITEKVAKLYSNIYGKRDDLLGEVRAKLDSHRYQENNYRYDGSVAAVAEYHCYGEFPMPKAIGEVSVDITLGITYGDFINGFMEHQEEKPEERHVELRDLATAQITFQHQKIAEVIESEVVKNIDDCFARIEKDVAVTFLCRFGSEKDLEANIESLEADRDTVKNATPLFAGEVLNILKKGISIIN